VQRRGLCKQQQDPGGLVLAFLRGPLSLVLECFSLTKNILWFSVTKKNIFLSQRQPIVLSARVYQPSKQGKRISNNSAKKVYL
jgi:hypothetical protein